MTTIKDQIDKAEDIALKLAGKVKTHQIRNFFGQVSQIKIDFERDKPIEEIKRSIFLLKPLLAYATGRQGKDKMLEFYNVILEQIELVINTKTTEEAKVAIKDFFEFCTAIVAYHKFYESKN